jgi:hypothetical protein
MSNMLYDWIYIDEEEIEKNRHHIDGWTLIIV